MVLNTCLPKGVSYFSFASKGAVQYDNGIYQYINYPYVLKFDGEKAIELYDIMEDELQQKNLIDKATSVEVQQEMTKYLKAIIQQYTNRLIDNKLY
jgi:hypothetical protein